MTFVTFSRLFATPPAQIMNPTSTFSPMKRVSSQGSDTMPVKTFPTSDGAMPSKEPVINRQQ